MPPPIHKTVTEKRLLKMVIHGAPESGKTHLAATAHNDERLGPALLICLEAGLEALDNWPEEDRPPHVNASDDSGRWDLKVVEEIFWAVASGSKEYRDFDTVIWDTYSEGYESQLQAEVRNRAGKGVWETGETTSQYDYAQTNRKMRDLSSKLRDLQKNVIVTCHSKIEEVKKGDVVIGHQWNLAVSPGSAAPLSRKFPFVGFLEIKEPKATAENPDPEAVRVFHSKPSARYFSKAKGVLERVGNLQNPSMTEIMDKIDGR